MQLLSEKITTFKTIEVSCKVVISKELYNKLRFDNERRIEVFSYAKSCMYLALKQSHTIFPKCHQEKIEDVQIEFILLENQIDIVLIIGSSTKSNLRTQALHGLSIAAIAIKDEFSDLYSDIKISEVKIIKERGLESDYLNSIKKDLNIAILVISDSVAAGKKQDQAGKVVIQLIEELKLKINSYSVIADEKDLITETVKNLATSNSLILTCGGTGLSKRDVTPEAIKDILEKEIPGIMEAARVFGQNKTPYAMLSRGVAGFINDCLVITLPGSTRGAKESMQLLFPHVLHIFKVREQFYRHEDSKN